MDLRIRKDFLDLIQAGLYQNIFDKISFPKGVDISEKYDPDSLIPLENVINYLPGMIYWKDTKGVYLGCNNKTVRAVGLKTATEIIGQFDLNFCWCEQVIMLRENDQRCMQTASSLILQENVQLITEESLNFEVVKTPLWDTQKNIVGVIGCSLESAELEKIKYLIANKTKKLSTFPHFLNNMSFFENIQKKYIIESKDSQAVNLSNREIQVLYHLFMGYTAKETSKILKISFRTVEQYLDNAKKKLGCKKKFQLIKLMLQNSNCEIG
jgi:DNA-binding CsgD family transcriptional regulator